ncbi:MULTISPECIES: flavoprotein [unclassified Streptomyces]|uniref:flavoprotein n=1 Tax=unclassified Streptomyces TaxID=2593676 RepID=UPI0029AA18DE|nr:flavoprotein [Streptomyces sp. DK15]MDX2390003.1 flavoprotein [Streptomyces sp. DK15]
MTEQNTDTGPADATSRTGAAARTGAAEAPEATAPAAPVGLGFTRLLLIATGSVSAAELPSWIAWLRATHPELEIQTVLTRSAQRFVTRESLNLLTGRRTMVDAWPEEPVLRAPHVDLTAWAEAVLVHPSTFSYTARLALGLADSPSLLTAQCTAAPVAVAPALPPGGVRSHAYRRHVESLAERPNCVVVPPVPALSLTTGRTDSWAAAPLPEVLDALAALHHRLTAEPTP